MDISGKLRKLGNLSDIKFTKPSIRTTNKIKKHTFNLAVAIFRYAMLIAVGYIVIFPIISMICTAIKAEEAFFDVSLYWLPKYISADAFTVAANAMQYGKSLMSTLTIPVLSGVIEILICSVIAYGFARFDFKFKKVFNLLLMMTIVVPIPIYIVSMLVNYRSFDVFGILSLFDLITGIDVRPNLLDTPLTFYLPSIFGVGLRSGILIYIYIQFMSGLPKELEEAAWIDGAGPFETFLKIAVPSSGVVFLTVSVFSIIWHWNDSYLGVMYLTENYPLAIQLNSLGDLLKINNPFSAAASTSMIRASKMAGCLLFITPLLVGYLCVQNKFVKSIDRVGITG